MLEDRRTYRSPGWPAEQDLVELAGCPRSGCEFRDEVRRLGQRRPPDLDRRRQASVFNEIPSLGAGFRRPDFGERRQEALNERNCYIGEPALSDEQIGDDRAASAV